MKIVVTAEDIADGLRAEPSCCPVALACKRAGLKGVEATHGMVFLWAESAAPVPPMARAFMVDYDAGRPVEPFEFDLPVEGP